MKNLNDMKNFLKNQETRKFKIFSVFSFLNAVNVCLEYNLVYMKDIRHHTSQQKHMLKCCSHPSCIKMIKPTLVNFNTFK